MGLGGCVWVRGLGVCQGIQGYCEKDEEDESFHFVVDFGTKTLNIKKGLNLFLRTSSNPEIF